MVVKILPNETGRPIDKLADVELHFEDGPLRDMRLIGFAVWKRRGSDEAKNVTFPARMYSVNGEKRSYALLRPVTDSRSHDAVRDFILTAYAEWAAAKHRPEPPVETAQMPNAVPPKWKPTHTLKGAAVLLDIPKDRMALVIGPNCWGKDVSVAKAIKNARSNHSPSMTGPFRAIIYHVDSRTVVDEMGGLNYHIDSPPVEIARIGK
jgi:hypothetical protein